MRRFGCRALIISLHRLSDVSESLNSLTANVFSMYRRVESSQVGDLNANDVLTRHFFINFNRSLVTHRLLSQDPSISINRNGNDSSRLLSVSKALWSLKEERNRHSIGLFFYSFQLSLHSTRLHHRVISSSSSASRHFHPARSQDSCLIKAFYFPLHTACTQ